jgi:hypothetical protein
MELRENFKFYEFFFIFKFIQFIFFYFIILKNNNFFFKNLNFLSNLKKKKN